jgi:hypothetical protein
MGAFAAMAQNGYGLVILGGVAFTFAAVFLYQLMQKQEEEKRATSAAVELFGLFLLASILGLRVFYIHFTMVELIFEVSALMLIIVYGQDMVTQFSRFKPKNSVLSVLILVFFLSIICYLIALALVPVLARFSGAVGIIAFVLLLVFVLSGLLYAKPLIDGETVSVFRIVSRFKSNALLVIALFSLFTMYEGFTKTGLLPRLYDDEFPQAYFDMLNEAESGKELPVNGRFRYQEFKEKYDAYLSRNK